MRDPRRLTADYREATEECFRSADPVWIDDNYETERLVELSLTTLRSRVRSPLEALLGVRLIEALARRRTVAWDPRSGPADRSKLGPVRLVTFCCNLRIDRFSFDFWIRSDVESALFRSPRQTMLVECDGAAWHWGRQVERDRRKDELAAAFDWVLFRLPSRRILANPSGCADELVNYALDGLVQTPGVLHD